MVAVLARDEAERQTRVAQARQLAAQADLLRERGGATDASLMIAAEALRLLSAAHQRSLEVDLSVRRALAGLPFAVADIDTSFEPDSLSPDGRLLVTHRTGDDLVPFELPAGTEGPCRSDAIAAADDGADPSAPRLVRAITDDGRHCILQQDHAANRHTLELWSALPLQRIDRLAFGSQAGHVQPGLSRDGEFIALNDRAQRGGVQSAVFRLWSRSRGAEVLRRPGVEFRGFSPDGRHFAITDAVWRLPSGAGDLPEPVLSWPTPAQDVVFSRDGSQVAARGAFDGPAQVRALASPSSVSERTPPAGRLLAVQDDGRRIVLACAWADDVSTIVWDMDQDDPLAAVPLGAAAAVFVPGGVTLAVQELQRSAGPATVRVVTMPLHGAARAGTELPADSEVRHLAVTDGHVDVLLRSATGLRLARWDFTRGTWADTAAWPGAKVSALARDGRAVAVAAGREVVVTWLHGSAGPRRFDAGIEPTLPDLGAMGRHVAAHAGGRVQVWDTATGKVSVRALAEPADALRVDLGRSQPLPSTCMVSGDGRHLRSGGAFQALPAASVARGVVADDLVECLAPAQRALRLQAEGTRLTVVDATTRTPLAQLEHGLEVDASAVSASGRTVASVDAAGGLRVFALAPAELISSACARQPRPLQSALRSLVPPAAQKVDACGRE